MATRLMRKVVPPALPEGHIRRAAINTLLDVAMSRRVTLVVGGAGWGKTSALASWAAQGRVAWLALGPEDDQLDRLVSALIQSLHVYVPSLPADLPTALESTLGPHVDDLYRADAFSANVAELIQEHLPGDLALVVDDIDVLSSGGPSMRLVEGLCRQVPQQLHLVLACRTQPPFSLQRLRGQGQVLDLDLTRFPFDAEEAETLLTNTCGPGGAELVPELLDMTAGWPAALSLAVEALRGVPPSGRVAALGDLRRPGGRLLNYLAEEVFGREPAPLRLALVQLAALGRAPGQLCADLRIVPSRESLQLLAQRGLLQCTPAPGDAWSVSRPIHDLIDAHHALGEDESAELHSRAAAWYDAQGQPGEALGHLIAAGSSGPVASFIRARGVDLVHGGHVLTVLEAAACLDPAVRDAAVERIVGEAHHVRGDWVGASECYRRAAEGSESVDAALAWRIGLIHHFRGELDDALKAYAAGKFEDEDTVDEALLLAWSATAEWLRGDYVASLAHAHRAEEAARRCRDPRAMAASHTVLAMLAASSGDHLANAAFYASALEAAQRAGDVLQIIRIRVNRGSHFAEEGLAREALAELEAAIPLAAMTGYAFLHALALNNRGEAEELLGRLDEAAADYREARDLYQQVASRMISYPLAGIGRIHALRGEVVLARAAFEEALAAAEMGGDVQGLGAALVGLGRIRAADDIDAARHYAKRAVEEAGELARVQALLACGWIALVAGDPDTAVFYGRAAADGARARRDRSGLAEALELTVASGDADGPASMALLDEALTLWQAVGSPIGQARVTLVRASRTDPPSADETRDAARELLRYGVRVGWTGAASPLACLPAIGPSVSVMALGAFRVLRDGAPVPATEWQSRKARELLKYLVARRGQPVPRDQLIDLLWPDEATARLGNRLSVLLSTVRAILDPERSSVGEGPIVTDRAAVWLDMDRLDIDVERFLSSAVAGLAAEKAANPEAAGLLLDSEGLYGGDFLAEDPYADWAVPLREEARSCYASVVRALARLATAAGDTDGALRYGLRLIDQDRYDEEAHLRLVHTLAVAGRHGEAHRRYAMYVAQMAAIDVEPAAFPAASRRAEVALP